MPRNEVWIGLVVKWVKWAKRAVKRGLVDGERSGARIEARRIMRLDNSRMKKVLCDLSMEMSVLFTVS